MLKETPQNVARLAMTLCRLAMTLCNQINVKETDYNAMRGVYKCLELTVKKIREPGFANNVAIPSDMATVEWQTFVGMTLMTLLAQKKGKTPTEQQAVNMSLNITVAVEKLIENMDLADEVARVVLGPLYPSDKGLPDGHHRTK